MSDLLALDRSSLPNKGSTMPARRSTLRTMLRNFMEALLSAHNRNFEKSGSTFYRYPPI